MKTMDQKEFARENVFGLGAENTAYAKYFIGQSYLNPLTNPESGLFLAMSPLSRVVGTTGIFTTPKKAADRC